MRDPRLEPVAGDVVISADERFRRFVVERVGSSIEYQANGQDHNVCLGTWRRWCRKQDAEVVARGDDGNA